MNKILLHIFSIVVGCLILFGCIFVVLSYLGMGWLIEDLNGKETRQNK